MFPIITSDGFDAYLWKSAALLANVALDPIEMNMNLMMSQPFSEP